MWKGPFKSPYLMDICSATLTWRLVGEGLGRQPPPPLNLGGAPLSQGGEGACRRQALRGARRRRRLSHLERHLVLERLEEQVVLARFAVDRPEHVVRVTLVG